MPISSDTYLENKNKEKGLGWYCSHIKRDEGKQHFGASTDQPPTTV
jgi:hypothetical protein